MDKVVEYLGLEREELIMVGDNYLIDIWVGIDNGILMFLVIIGFIKVEEVVDLLIVLIYVVFSFVEWDFDEN